MLGVMGWQLELTIGKIKFLLIYFAAGLGGNVLSALVEMRTGDYAVSAGASGAIFGIIGALLYIAVRNQALLNNDAYTLKMLQSSPIQARITEAAQRLSLVRNYTGNGEHNVVKLLNDLQKVYDGKVDAKTRAEIQEQVQNLSDIIKRFDMDTETAWNNLLSDMECR